MGQHILPGNPPVENTLRRSARAWRISLRVSGLDGRVTLTLPSGTSEREALAFAREKADWLRGHIGAQGAVQHVGLGTVVPFQGAEVTIALGTGRRVQLSGDTLLVPGPPEAIGARLEGFFKHSARDSLAAASDHYAGLLGLSYGRLTLRDTRSRWGSCSSSGGLMYSWRLILAPPAVLNYVAAHEVAHLEQMNHSQAFWDVVHRIHGDHTASRRWLREHGGALHRFRFGD